MLGLALVLGLAATAATAPLVVQTNDALPPPIYSTTQTFSFDGNRYVITFRFDGAHDGKLKSAQVVCWRTAKTLRFEGPLYPRWTSPLGSVYRDAKGRSVEARFVFPVSTRAGEQTPDRFLAIDCEHSKATIQVSE